MKPILSYRFAVLLTLLMGCAGLTVAQDSVKSPAVTRPVTVKQAVAKPGPGQPGYVNPYSKYKNPAVPPAAGSPATTTGTAQVPGSAVKPAYAYPAVVDSALLKDKSLNGQYQYFLTKIYRYQQPLASALWKNVMDSLTADRHKLKESQAKLTAQTNAINNLQTEKNQAVNEATLDKADEMSFVGLPMSKTTYNLIMWGLVVVFAAVAMVVIARSGADKTEAAYRTTLYNELEEEYKTYKTKANDKEKKLARELQTERNKVDELMGRG